MADFSINLGVQNNLTNVLADSTVSISELSAMFVTDSSGNQGVYSSTVKSGDQVKIDLGGMKGDTINLEPSDGINLIKIDSTTGSYAQTREAALAQINGIQLLKLESDLAMDVPAIPAQPAVAATSTKAAIPATPAVPATRSATNQAAQNAIDERNSTRKAFNEELSVLRNTFSEEFSRLDKSRSRESYTKSLTAINGDSKVDPPILSQLERLEIGRAHV